MGAPVFLLGRGALSGVAVGGTLLLDGPEGRHAAKVRRLQAGEPVHVVDGAGAVAECVVAAAARESLDLQVVARHDEPEPQPRLVVVQAVPKADRGELAVELMTEVGVDVVVPWAAARCVAQWRGDRADRALARWRSTAREAAKQARRPWVPDVRPLASTADVARLVASAAASYVLSEGAGLPYVAAPVPARGEVVLVVGPEGGISPEELATFATAGAAAYRLGPTVLRTSTAGAAAAAVLLSRTARWS